jgi:hypothetical protein
VGGVWKFRTTSYNSVVGILSSLAMIQRITGGRLAGIPMNMTVSPKTVADPIKGSQQTIYVVGLQYAGTMDSLRETGYQIAMTEAKHGISMKRIEEDAMLMLSHTPTSGLGDDSAEDVIEEFYPEEAQPGAPTLVEPEVVTAVVTKQAADAPPTLAAVMEEVVDTETGEVTEQAAAPVEPVKEKAKGTRRTKAEIEAEKAAQLAAAVVETNKTDPAYNDDDFPDPPGVAPVVAPVLEAVIEEPPHPADEPEPAEPVTEEEMGDLF